MTRPKPRQTPTPIPPRLATARRGGFRPEGGRLPLRPLPGRRAGARKAGGHTPFRFFPSRNRLQKK